MMATEVRKLNSRNFRSCPPAVGVLASGVALVAAVLASAAASGAAAPASRAAAPAQTRAQLEQQFARTVKPFLQANCIACHGKEKPQAQLDLSSYTNMTTAAQD